MAPKTTKRPKGRPVGAHPPIPVTGYRIPPDVLARVDALVERRGAELAKVGGTVTRTSIIVAALRAYCDAEGV